MRKKYRGSLHYLDYLKLFLSISMDTNLSVLLGMEDLLNRKLTYLYDHHCLKKTFQSKHNSFETLNLIK